MTTPDCECSNRTFYLNNFINRCVQEYLSQNFYIIMDGYNRPGEKQTIASCMNCLRCMGYPIGQKFMKGLSNIY